jgi:hypothetical protein
MSSSSAVALPTSGRPFRRAHVWSGIALLVLIAFVLDSTALTARFAYGQWVANALMIAVFFLVLRFAPPRLRGVMWWGLVVGTGGEIVFSLFVGMYEYRLANVPIYVPPGHSLVYAAVYYFVREPWVRAHARHVQLGLLAVCVGYSVFWLVARGDAYGFVCTLLFLYLIWKHESSRLFFLGMYLFVAYLELVGTSLGCWYWHPTLLDKFAWMPSGNPPSGISVFYFGFDVACLDFYARQAGLLPRYERLKARRLAREAAATGQTLAAAE